MEVRCVCVLSHSLLRHPWAPGNPSLNIAPKSLSGLGSVRGQLSIEGQSPAPARPLPGLPGLWDDIILPPKLFSDATQPTSLAVLF